MADEKKPRPRGAPPLPRVFGRPPGAPSLNGHGPDVPKPADPEQKPSAGNQPQLKVTTWSVSRTITTCLASGCAVEGMRKGASTTPGA